MPMQLTPFTQLAPTVRFNPASMEFNTIAMPELPRGGAIIQTLGCGLCGSDVEKLALQKVPAGAVLGHEVVGRIIQLDVAYRGTKKTGDRIALAHHVPCGTCHYCMNESPSMCAAFKASNFVPGGFAPYFAITEDHLEHTAFPIPPHISDREAFNVEPLACVLRAVRRAGLPKGEGSAAIIGLGYIGLLLAQVLRHDNQTVIGLDLNPQRLGLAYTMEWCQHIIQPQRQQAELAEVLKQLPCHAVDAVYLTVVNATTLKQALQLVRNGGSIVLMAGNTQGMILDPADLYYREVNVVTSYSPALEDLAEAARLITRTPH
jgi:L-iditol 2-dehydrogenase